MMRKKMNNKGFSLVELIVVMAIMAILAVTLAPRLFAYVDKAKQTNDRELVNNIYSTVKYALLDEKMYKGLYTETDAATHAVTNVLGTTTWNATESVYQTVIKLRTDGYYTVSDKSWTTGANTHVLMREIYDVIGNFKLQSKKAKATSEILITLYGTKSYKVQLDYNNTGSTFDYELDSTDAS